MHRTAEGTDETEWKKNDEAKRESKRREEWRAHAFSCAGEITGTLSMRRVHEKHLHECASQSVCTGMHRFLSITILFPLVCLFVLLLLLRRSAIRNGVRFLLVCVADGQDRFTLLKCWNDVDASPEIMSETAAIGALHAYRWRFISFDRIVSPQALAYHYRLPVISFFVRTNRMRLNWDQCISSMQTMQTNWSTLSALEMISCDLRKKFRDAIA